MGDFVEDVPKEKQIQNLFYSIELNLLVGHTSNGTNGHFSMPGPQMVTFRVRWHRRSFLLVAVLKVDLPAPAPRAKVSLLMEEKNASEAIDCMVFCL